MSLSLEAGLRPLTEITCDAPAGTPAEQLSVGIVGMGYVGLPTALSFLDAGFSVIGLDVSEARLGAIRDQSVDLLPRDELRLGHHLESTNLTLSANPKSLRNARAIIVCVPTPVDSNLVPDLGPLRSACRAVVENAVPGQLIVLTSTTYVGCTRDFVVEPLRERGFIPGVDVHVVFSPERIDPGVAHHRPEETPRVVGGHTSECTRRAMGLLEPTCRNLHAVRSLESAEMTKLLENTFRAVNIALINEFADSSRALGVDIAEVIDAAATKPYGFMKFMPGPGVGGHCIPCDPHYLLWQLRSLHHDAPVTDAAMRAIAHRPSVVTARVTETLAELGVAMASARVHVVGVAFKAGVADLRESPALEILEWLDRHNVRVSYTDAHVPALRLRGRMLHSVDRAPDGTDLILVLTLHSDADLEWLEQSVPALDASFRASGRNIRRV